MSLYLCVTHTTGRPVYAHGASSFPCTKFIFLLQTLFSSYKLYYHRTNFIFLVQTLLLSYKLCFSRTNFISLVQTLYSLYKLYIQTQTSVSTWKPFICHTNFISIGKLNIDLQPLNLPVAAVLEILYAERDVFDLGLSRAQGPNFPLSMVSPLRALFSMAMFCNNCGGFCSRGWS